MNKKETPKTPEVHEESSIVLNFGKYQIRRLDTYNIVLEESKITQSGANKGKEYFVTLTYHNKLEDAIDSLLRRGVEKKSIKKLEEVSENLKTASKDIRQHLNTNHKALIDLI